MAKIRPVGDRVVVKPTAKEETEFKLDNEEYLVLKENDILAIIG